MVLWRWQMTERLVRLQRAARNPKTVARFHKKIVRVSDSDCWIWTGAVAGRGHGRFWVEKGLVAIAHRFSWLLQHMDEDLPAVVTHSCDNPLCQNPEHLHAGSAASNRSEWSQRRTTPRSPLRDIRGSLGRALALRDSARQVAAVSEAVAAGWSEGDRYQRPLW